MIYIMLSKYSMVHHFADDTNLFVFDNSLKSLKICATAQINDTKSLFRFKRNDFESRLAK